MTWRKFLNKKYKYVILCETQEEVDKFCQEMYNHGEKWFSGKSYLSKFQWDGRPIYFSNVNGFTYDKEYVKNHGYKIYKLKDLG